MKKPIQVTLISFILLIFCFLSGCFKENSSGPDKKAEAFHYRLGVEKYESGDYDAAISFYQKAIEINPQSEKALIDLGIIYEDLKKDIPKAMNYYQQFLLVQPDGDKAEMVKGWLMKLAVNHEEIDGAKVTSKENQGTFVSLNAKMLEENKKLKKELEGLQNNLVVSRQKTESLRGQLGEHDEENKEKLKTADAEIESLKGKLNEALSSKKESASKSTKQNDAIFKQKIARLEKDKQVLEKESSSNEEALKEKIKELSKENDLALKQLETFKKSSVSGKKESTHQLKALLQEKRKTDKEMSRLKTDLDRLKEAFATATKERARLNKMIEEKEGTIGALKGQLAKIAQQKIFQTEERQSYEQQISLLKKRTKNLEEERDNYRRLSKNRINEKSPPKFVVPPNKEYRTSTPLNSLQTEKRISSIKPNEDKDLSRKYDLVTYHRVKRGETLMMIAGYSHIYRDRSKWKIIYEANKANIDDPNVLVPGQILLVPR